MDRTEAQATYTCVEAAEAALALINRAHLILCEIEGACPEYFAGASTLFPDPRSDLQAMKDRADEAVGEYDVQQAYGERPSGVALVAEGGASL